MKSDVIYRIIRAQIEGGKFGVGENLPSEITLATEHRVARGTVRTALRQLAEEGFIRSAQGRQRIVDRREPLHLEKIRIPYFPAEADAASFSSSFGEHLDTLDCRPKDTVLANATRVRCYGWTNQPRLLDSGLHEKLGIEPDGEVVWCLRLRFANEEPIAMQWVVTPAELVTDIPLEQLVPGGLTLLYQRYGIVRCCAKAECSPTRASKMESAPLGVQTGVPLIEERRISYFRNKHKIVVPYEYLVSLYTNRVSLTFTWNDYLQKAQPKPGKHGLTSIKMRS